MGEVVQFPPTGKQWLQKVSTLAREGKFGHLSDEEYRLYCSLNHCLGEAVDHNLFSGNEETRGDLRDALASHYTGEQFTDFVLTVKVEGYSYRWQYIDSGYKIEGEHFVQVRKNVPKHMYQDYVNGNVIPFIIDLLYAKQPFSIEIVSNNASLQGDALFNYERCQAIFDGVTA